MKQRWTLATRPVFPSMNDLGIPQLLPQMVDLPNRLALRPEDSGPGSLVIDRTLKPRAGSLVGFWVDDYRLEPLWERPAASLARLGSSVFLIEPDFSSYSDHPFAVAVWNLYRSRWVARWWQSQGRTVLPQLSFNRQTLRQMTFGLHTGCPFACECRPRFKDQALLLKGLRKGIEELQPSAVLLYGAEESLLTKLPAGPRYVTVPAWSPRRRMNLHRQTAGESSGHS